MRVIQMSHLSAVLSLLLIAGLCPAQSSVDYETQIQPIFLQNCTKCHGAKKQKGGLRLDAYQAQWLSGEHAIIAAGNPAESELYEFVKLPLDDPDHMPPKSSLSNADIKLLGQWISDGAKGPSKKSVNFKDHIEPILNSSCISCHGEKRQKGGLRLDRFDVSLTEGEHPALVRGNPLESEIFKRISLDADDPDVMPSNGKLLKPEQITLIKTWIAEGAAWPVGTEDSKPDAEQLWQQRFDMGEITDAQRREIKRALASINAAGGVGGPVAQTSDAVDINFSLAGKRIKNEQLESLRGLEQVLVWLNLARTKIDDAAAGKIGAFNQLQRLDVSRTQIGDPFINQLRALQRLSVLNLYGTSVSDQSIDTLAQMKSLERLYLWNSKVTPEGAAKLRKALPECRIDIGEHRVVTPRVALVPVNTQCPVMDKPVNADFAVTHKGKRVAFCCGKCMAAFVKDPTKFEAKLKTSGKATEADTKALADALPINTRCPVSGSAVTKEHWTVHNGKKVAFCCGKCKAAFAKSPAKFEGKLNK